MDEQKPFWLPSTVECTGLHVLSQVPYHRAHASHSGPTPNHLLNRSNVRNVETTTVTQSHTQSDMSILDEIDSGLDIDALRDVAKVCDLTPIIVCITPAIVSGMIREMLSYDVGPTRRMSVVAWGGQVLAAGVCFPRQVPSVALVQLLTPHLGCRGNASPAHYDVLARVRAQVANALLL